MVNPKHQHVKEEVLPEEIAAIKHIEEGFRILARTIAKSIVSELKAQSLTPTYSERVATPDKLTYSVPEAAGLLGLSRASAYKAVRTKQLPSITLGSRIFIPRVALHRLLNDNINAT